LQANKSIYKSLKANSIVLKEKYDNAFIDLIGTERIYLLIVLFMFNAAVRFYANLEVAIFLVLFFCLKGAKTQQFADVLPYLKRQLLNIVTTLNEYICK